MAKTLSLTAPDDVIDSMVAALCLKGNWAQVGDLSLGDAGKQEFASKMLLDHVMGAIEEMKMAEIREAANQQQQKSFEVIRSSNAQARANVKIVVK